MKWLGRGTETAYRLNIRVRMPSGWVKQQILGACARKGTHNMRHIQAITVPKASDAAGAIFFQIWLSVITWMLTGAFGSKK